MKEQLSDENIQLLVQYRYQRALETIQEIPYLKNRAIITLPSTDCITLVITQL